MPSKKDTSGDSKATEVAANPHSTLVNFLEMVHSKFSDEPSLPLTIVPPYDFENGCPEERKD